MSMSKRVLVLAGCVLVAAACTQDSTTAPPVAADVGIEVLPGTYGSEAGKITLTAVRGSTACGVRVAFTSLFQDEALLNDSYYLRLKTSTASLWQSPVITVSGRGTYRGTFDYLIYSSAWTSATEMVLGYWDGSFHDTHIADMASGVIGNLNPNFTIVDRCH